MRSSYERIPDDQRPVEDALPSSARYTDNPAAASVLDGRPPIYYGEGPFDPPSSEDVSVLEDKEEDPQPLGEDEYDAELQLSATERKVCALFCARTTRRRGVPSCMLTCHFHAETIFTSRAGHFARCARRLGGINRNNRSNRIFGSCDFKPWISENNYGSYIQRDILSYASRCTMGTARYGALCMRDSSY